MIRIAYPDFFFKAISVSTTSAASGVDAEAFISGSRKTLWESDSATTQSVFTLELGTQGRPNYVIIADARYLTGKDSFNASPGPLDITVEGANNSIFTTGVVNQTSQFTGVDLVGLTRRDIVFPNIVLGNRIHWRVVLDTADSEVHRLSKIYMGTFFTFGVEPNAPIPIQNLQAIKSRSQSIAFSLTWEGVTQAKIESFLTLIDTHIQNNPVFLYETDTNRILLGYELVHAHIKRAYISPLLKNSASITVDFEGLI